MPGTKEGVGQRSSERPSRSKGLPEAELEQDLKRQIATIKGRRGPGKPRAKAAASCARQARDGNTASMTR